MHSPWKGRAFDAGAKFSYYRSGEGELLYLEDKKRGICLSGPSCLPQIRSNLSVLDSATLLDPVTASMTQAKPGERLRQEVLKSVCGSRILPLERLAFLQLPSHSVNTSWEPPVAPTPDKALRELRHSCKLWCC